MQSLVKVTAPAASTRLTTLAAAQAECSTDTDVSALIDRASAAVARYCGRAFGLQTITETFRRNHVYWRDPLVHTRRDNRPIVLRYAYDQTPSSVTVDGGTALVADTDYEIDLEAGMMWRLFSGTREWWQCMTNIVAVYQTGWNLPNDGSPNLPADVEACCLAIVRSAFNAVGSDPTVSREMTEGVGLVNYFARPISGLVMDAGLMDALSGYMVRS